MSKQPTPYFPLLGHAVQPSIVSWLATTKEHVSHKISKPYLLNPQSSFFGTENPLHPRGMNTLFLIVSFFFVFFELLFSYISIVNKDLHWKINKGNNLQSFLDITISSELRSKQVLCQLIIRS